MRRPRLTIRDQMVILAILALIGSVPIRSARNEREVYRQFLVNYYETEARELSISADLPDGWMDEFRPDLRRLAEARKEMSRQVARTGDRVPRDPIEVSEEDKFWARFGPIANRNGFHAPRLQPWMLKPHTIVDDLAVVWPGLLALLLLPCIGPVRRLAARLLSGLAATPARRSPALGEAGPSLNPGGREARGSNERR